MTYRHFFTVLWAGFAAVLLTACKNDPAVQAKIDEVRARNDGPAIFVVTDPGDETAGRVYIYPTLEALPVRMDFRRDDLLAVMDEVGSIYTLRPDTFINYEIYEEEILKSGYLPASESLSGLLPNLQQKQLLAALLNDRQSPEEFERYRPWYAANRLLHGQYDVQDLSYNWSVEKQIDAIWGNSGKRFAYLETPQDNIRFQSSISPEAEREYLSYVLATPTDTPFDPDFHRIWISGQAEKAGEAFDARLSEIAPAFMDELILPRRQRWSSWLTARIEKGENALAFIDIIYVFGDDGIFEDLQARGFTVTRYNHADKGPVIKTIDLSIDPNE